MTTLQEQMDRTIAKALEKRERISSAEQNSFADCETDKKAMESVMHARGVDLAYLGWTLDKFGLPKHQSWLNGGYLLRGLQGCGKSCCAGALIRDRLDPAHPKTLAEQEEHINEDGSMYRRWAWPATWSWFGAWDLCDIRRRAWDEKGEALALKMILKNRVVVIDDIGAERGTANQDAINVPWIRRVIDKCIHNGVGLIVTTNLALDEMEDARLGSRLCDLDEIRLPEIDFRAKAKRARAPIVARMEGAA